MPEPVAVGSGVFAFQSIGQVDSAVPSGQVLFMQAFDPLQVFLERGDEAIGEHGSSFPRAIADGDRLVFKVNVLHPQTEARHQAQAGTVEQLGHQAVGAGHLSDDPAHLFPGQDGGQAFGLLGAQGVNGSQVLVKHLSLGEWGEDSLGKGTRLWHICIKDWILDILVMPQKAPAMVDAYFPLRRGIIRNYSAKVNHE